MVAFKKFDHQLISLPQITETTIDARRHYITPAGTFPSVTTILGHMEKNSALVEWYKKVGEKEGNRIKNISAHRGHEVHKICQRYLENKLFETMGSIRSVEKDIDTGIGDIPRFILRVAGPGGVGTIQAGSFMPDTIGIFKKMQVFLDQIKTVYAIEAGLYSVKHRFAGRTDTIADWGMPKKPCIIDFKTNNSDVEFTEERTEKYFVQLAGYALGWEERVGFEIDRGLLIFGSNDFGASIAHTNLATYKKQFIEIRNSVKL